MLCNLQCFAPVTYKSLIPGQENELLLMAVLDCLFNSVSGILRKNVDKKSLCDNMEVVMLAMDEMIDNGMIMESDPQQVVTTWCTKINCTTICSGTPSSFL